jgi:uncharacterized protein (DUF849 family)
MTTPCIITAAITGALPRKAQTPAVPVTPSEQIESTHEAYEAGCALVHIHVRNKDESPSSDPDLFAQVQEGVKKHCPGIIIQHSTGGRGRNQNERGRCITLRPDMASLTTGSVNFPNQIYENPPQLVEDLAKSMLNYGVKPEIEVFDLAMLYNARDLAEKGLIKKPLHVQFVLGVPNALQGAGIPDRGAQGHNARRHLGRGRRRPSSAGGEQVDAGAGRARAHRARGQHQVRQGSAGQEQCRAGGAHP